MKPGCLLLFFVLIFPLYARAQSNSIKKISGLPTKEIYNIMIDSRGFLWITHDLGVSRYDGVNFISYSSPEQTSLSATDLLEDKKGRIWFHNFTGQIFYIENEQVHLLKGYDYKKESTFPRIGLLGDELVASTKNGLFTCNTNNLSCRYLKCENSINKGTTALAVMSNAVIAYGDGNWFLYRKGAALKMVTLKGDSTDYVKINTITLGIKTFRDTAYAFSNPASVLARITLEGDVLKLSKKISTSNFINTVNIDGNDVWVNTIHKSFLLNNTNEQLSGYNITAILTDETGNTWYSSKTDGLMVKYRKLPGSLQPINILRDDDRVKCVKLSGPTLVMGTQNGNILLYDIKREKVFKTISLPGYQGTVDYLYNIDGSRFLVGTSVNTYEMDIDKNTVKLLSDIKTLKEADKTSQYLYAASASGLIVTPLKQQATLKPPSAGNLKYPAYLRNKSDRFIYKMRCRAVCYNPRNKLIYVAFKDGVYTIDDKGAKPFVYNGSNVYAMCLKYINGRVLIGTIDNGLLITDGIDTRSVTVNDGLASNTILRIKTTEEKVWILSPAATTLLDTTNFKIIKGIDLSSLAETQVLDVAATKNKAYVITSEGFNLLSITNSIVKFNLKNYLQAVLVNDKPIPFAHLHSFANAENNLQFNLAVPFYYHSHDIYFKYQLNGTNNQSWQTTQPGDRNISFSDLSPGKYKFKAFAVHPQFGRAMLPVAYEFSIAEQWWQTWLFKIFFTLFITILVAYIVANYLLNRLRTQKALYEQQLTIQKERKRISSEMHDDIGAGLSAVKLFLNMAKNNEEPGDINHISEMINDMAEKINEIIWSTDTENDSLESLLNQIEYQSYKLFKHTDINLNVVIPLDIPSYIITSEKRRNIYLATKEFLHNALKHSKASFITLDVKIEANELRIIIKDDGVGFNNFSLRSKGMGLKTTRGRVAELKGKTKIDSGKNGTTIILQIPLD